MVNCQATVCILYCRRSRFHTKEPTQNDTIVLGVGVGRNGRRDSLPLRPIRSFFNVWQRNFILFIVLQLFA